MRWPSTRGRCWRASSLSTRSPLPWAGRRIGVHSRARLYRRVAAGLPKTAALSRTGAIDGYRTGKVVEAADRLTRPESISDLDDKVAGRITDQTPTQLQRWLNRRVARIEPDAAEPRHRRAHADRRVCTEQGLDGMGSLWMAAGAADISAIDAHLTGLACGLGREDPRTMDQRRADLAVDLLSGCHGASTDSKQAAAGSALGVVVPLQSLLGVDDTPGELADRSASVPAPLARQIAARPGTLFYRLLTDARGNLLDVTQPAGSRRICWAWPSTSATAPAAGRPAPRSHRGAIATTPFRSRTVRPPPPTWAATAAGTTGPRPTTATTSTKPSPASSSGRRRPATAIRSSPNRYRSAPGHCQ